MPPQQIQRLLDIGNGRLYFGAHGYSVRKSVSDNAWENAAKQAYGDVWWPDPYMGGKMQLERNLARAALLRLQA